QAVKVPPRQIGPLPRRNRSDGDKLAPVRAALQIGQGSPSGWLAERPSRRADLRSFRELGRTQLHPSHHSGAQLAASENSRQLCRNFLTPSQAGPVVRERSPSFGPIAAPSQAPLEPYWAPRSLTPSWRCAADSAPQSCPWD